MKPDKNLSLFAVTGASGVGKSTICEILFKNETHYIVLEGDLFWHEVYNTPENDYRDYSELKLRVCANISQIGKPVVLCGCVVPEQLEVCDGRKFFSKIYYIAIVCDDDELENHMRIGRGINDENYIKSSIDFNRWLIENADKSGNKIKLINITELSPEEAAKKVDKWIINMIDKINDKG